jgi:hypothetical protein
LPTDLAMALSLCVSTRCAFRVKKSTTDDGDKRIDLPTVLLV